MICLTFDIEEFDTPREYGAPITAARQMEISAQGTERILELLVGFGVRATFFVTANFAEHRPHLVRRIVEGGHELASHSFYHSKFSEGDLLRSRETLERIGGCRVYGYRSPRMGGVEPADLIAAGYRYDSSINPFRLPGRYNYSNYPTTIFDRGGITEIPASVTPRLRLPLFWLSLHNFPLDIYNFLAAKALKGNGYLNLYFHPWEFTAECSESAYRLPFYIRRGSGEALAYRLGSVIAHFKARGAEFGTLSELCELRR